MSEAAGSCIEAFLRNHSDARRNVALQLQEANRLRQNERAGATIEIEARLCRTEEDDGELRSRVDGATFQRVCGMLQRSKHVKATTPGWRKVIDVFYVNQDGYVRGRSCVDSETMQFHSVNISKQRIQKVEYRVHGTTSGRAAFSTCTSRELVLESNQSELFVEPKFVRYKLVRSYRCASGGCTWRYDVSKVWAATRVVEASQLSRTATPSSYEVEIELEHWGDSVPCEYVADSLILKTVQLYLGCDEEIEGAYLSRDVG